jgi:hypothetical protein
MSDDQIQEETTTHPANVDIPWYVFVVILAAFLLIALLILWYTKKLPPGSF